MHLHLSWLSIGICQLLATDLSSTSCLATATALPLEPRNSFCTCSRCLTLLQHWSRSACAAAAAFSAAFALESQTSASCIEASEGQMSEPVLALDLLTTAAIDTLPEISLLCVHLEPSSSSHTDACPELHRITHAVCVLQDTLKM